MNHATATAGPDIVRGHRVPEDLLGDLLFAEPVGRLIRRAKIVKTEGLTQLRNAYPGSEFILSTDPLFRPVNMATAPDGTVYIADMYRGIIQEGQWTRPGIVLASEDSAVPAGQGHPPRPHLAPAVRRHAGVPGHAGRPCRRRDPRTARARPAIEPNRTQPRMLSETPAQLVAHLSHPNGWWRDSAQRLLVLKQDKSVVPALQKLVRDARTTCWRASTRCGRSKGSARSTPRWCASR